MKHFFMTDEACPVSMLAHNVLIKLRQTRKRLLNVYAIIAVPISNICSPCPFEIGV